MACFVSGLALGLHTIFVMTIRHGYYCKYSNEINEIQQLGSEHALCGCLTLWVYTNMKIINNLCEEKTEKYDPQLPVSIENVVGSLKCQYFVHCTSASSIYLLIYLTKLF